MDNKKKSGQTPLFPLSDEDMTFSQYLILFTIVFAQLAAMYIIQNTFKSSRLQGIGIIFLALSLVASGSAVIGYCRYLKRNKK